MRTNLVRGIVSTAIALTFTATAAWAAEMSVDSQVGTLLDNPDSKAVLEKHIPDFISNPQIEQARGMSLRSLQTFAPTLTDDVLAEIDEDLAEVSHEH